MNEEKSIDKVKLASLYGLILGGLISLLEYLRISGNMVVLAGFLSNLVTFGGIVFCMIRYRDSLGGRIKYGEAVKFGILVSVFSYVLFGIFMYFYSTIIHPGYFVEQFNMVKDVMSQNGFSALFNDEQMQNAIELTGNPIVMVLSYVMSGTILGTILSLIFGLIVKRN